MSKIDELLNSFEQDGDGWLYYGDVTPQDAQAEVAALRQRIAELEAALPFAEPDPRPVTREEMQGGGLA